LWYWARRRFTLPGLCVAADSSLAGGVGTDIENTVTYQIFALLLAFLILSFALQPVLPRKIFRDTFLPRFGTAGQPLHYRVLVKNLTAQNQKGPDAAGRPRRPAPAVSGMARGATRRKPPRASVSNHRTARISPFKLVNLKEAEVPPMLPGGETEVRVELTPLRRGILRFNGVTLARPDPLGLFRSFVKVSAANRFDSAETTLASTHRAARHDALSGRRRGAGGERRAQRGIRRAARLSSRRPDAAHPLAELGQDRQTHREGIRGRIFCAARAGAGHVHG
jgi:hypothetical protein